MWDWSGNFGLVRYPDPGDHAHIAVEPGIAKALGLAP
jgi:hypothetical protein